MHYIKSPTFAEAYKEVLKKILYNPEYIVSPRGIKTHEVSNMIIELTLPLSNMLLNTVRSTIKRYLAGELYFYFNGDPSVKLIEHYSSFWKKIANEDGTVNSNYGTLLFTENTLDNSRTHINFGPHCTQARCEWSWAVSRLIKDKNSRQSIIHFNKPHHCWDGTLDFPCTLTGVFSIREDKLNFTITMRSQDEFTGRIFDVPFFVLLQEQMLNHLIYTYPDLQLGSYTHITHSSHIYEKDFPIIEEMLKYEFIPDSLPPLKEDLVDTNGKPTKVFVSGETNDPLIKFIHQHMRDEKEIK
jgi:thymidylate synthase